MKIIKNKILTHCPACSNELTITRLSCDHCQIKIEGEFILNKFCRLPNEQVEFIDVFLKCRGNIKDVEKELGISYPTVRNRLDGVLQALGHQIDKNESPQEVPCRQDILDAVEKGELSSEEAARQLRKLKK